MAICTVKLHVFTNRWEKVEPSKTFITDFSDIFCYYFTHKRFHNVPISYITSRVFTNGLWKKVSSYLRERELVCRVD